MQAQQPTTSFFAFEPRVHARWTLSKGLKLPFKGLKPWKVAKRAWKALKGAWRALKGAWRALKEAWTFPRSHFWSQKLHRIPALQGGTFIVPHWPGSTWPSCNTNFNLQARVTGWSQSPILGDKWELYTVREAKRNSCVSLRKSQLTSQVQQ